MRYHKSKRIVWLEHIVMNNLANPLAVKAVVF